jgi:hypothetical protein
MVVLKWRLDDTHAQFVNEVAMMQNLCGAPGVVKMMDYILDSDPFAVYEPRKWPMPKNHHAALVLEYLEPSPTPFYALPSEQAQKDFFRQLCRARDPSPPNDPPPFPTCCHSCGRSNLARGASGT